MITEIFTIFFFFLHLPDISQHEMKIAAPEVRFDETHNIFVNKIDQFTVLYPKTLKATYFLNEHTTSFEDKNLEGFGLIRINVSRTDMLTNKDWVTAENVKRRNEPPIKIVGTKETDIGTIFYLKTPIRVDTDNDKPIYAHRDSAILVRDHKLYSFVLREQWEDAALKKDFLELIESFRFR